ncbi:MAG: MFS transporter, partial [archaeon]|nr:MFS transporter [archaeon]
MSKKGNKKHSIEKVKYPNLRPLWSSIFSDIMGFSLLIPCLPEIMELYDINISYLGLLLSTNALFGFIFGPILGKLSDKYGRKPLLLISQIGTCSGFLLLAFSNSIQMVFLSRIVDGIFGGNFPISKAIIGDVVAPKDRGIQMTNVGVAHNVSNLIAPAIGGISFGIFGIIGPGLMGAGLSLYTIIITVQVLEESAPIKTGLKKNMHQIGVGLKQPERKLNPPSMWKNTTVLLLLMLWGFHTLSFMTYISNFSIFTTVRFGFLSTDIGLFMSIAGVFQLFVRYVIFYPILKKVGEKTTARLGLSLFVIIFFLVGFVQNTTQLLILMLGLSFAASSARGLISGFLSRSTHPMNQGKVMGINSSLDSLA